MAHTKEQKSEWRKCNRALDSKRKREYMSSRPGLQSKYNRKQTIRRYGLTIEQFEAMVESQGGRCAICQRVPKTPNLYIDHDHKTNVVRGLLCLTCNTGLGSFLDNAVILRAAVAYLER